VAAETAWLIWAISAWPKGRASSHAATAARFASSAHRCAASPHSAPPGPDHSPAPSGQRRSQRAPSRATSPVGMTRCPTGATRLQAAPLATSAARLPACALRSNAARCQASCRGRHNPLLGIFGHSLLLLGHGQLPQIRVQENRGRRRRFRILSSLCLIDVKVAAMTDKTMLNVLNAKPRTSTTKAFACRIEPKRVCSKLGRPFFRRLFRRLLNPLNGFRRPKNVIKSGEMRSGTASHVGNTGSGPVGTTTQNRNP